VIFSQACGGSSEWSGKREEYAVERVRLKGAKYLTAVKRWENPMGKKAVKLAEKT